MRLAIAASLISRWSRTCCRGRRKRPALSALVLLPKSNHVVRVAHQVTRSTIRADSKGPFSQRLCKNAVGKHEFDKRGGPRGRQAGRSRAEGRRDCFGRQLCQE